MKKSIQNFQTFALQILQTQKTKISNLNPNSTKKILKTIDIENYLYTQLQENTLEIKSIEIEKNQLTIAKQLTEAILNYKNQGKTLKQIQEIQFTNQQSKIDFMKTLIQYEQYKTKHTVLDEQDIYQILTHHFQKNPKNLTDLNTNKYKISKTTYDNLTENQKQLIQTLNLEIETKPNPTTEKNQTKKETQTQTHPENIKIQAKNELSQNSFILEKLTQLKEQNPIQTKYQILTNIIENQTQLQTYLTNYGIQLETFATENLFEEPTIKLITNILHTINSPNSKNLETFALLENLNIRETTKRKITRKANRNEKSIYKVLTTTLENQKETFSEYADENDQIQTLSTNLIQLNKNKNSGHTIKNLTTQILKKFQIYETQIADNNHTQILCINELLKLIDHFQTTYQTKSLDQFLTYTTNLNQLKYNFETQTKTHSNITLTTIQNQNKNQQTDYTIITNLNHTKYPLLQKPNHWHNETFPTKEKHFKTQQQKFTQILTQTKIKNYLIQLQKNQNNILQKPSKLLEKITGETKPYTKQIEHYKPTQKDTIKQQSIKKISDLILTDNFDQAKSELELLKITFGKTDLTKFLSTQTPHQLHKDTFEDIDTSKIIYSISQLQTYESCPKKYCYNYIYKIPSQPRHYFDFGTSIHEALEFLSNDFNTIKPPAKLYTLGVKYLTNGWISKGYQTANQEKQYFKKGLQIIKEFIQRELELRKQNRQTIALEQKFFLDFEGRKLMGYIDRIDKHDGEIEIYDYKTSNSISNEKDLEKNMQLLVYSLASEQIPETQKFPKKVGLWYVLHNKIVEIEPNKDHTKEIKKRVIDTIKKIENKNFEPTPTQFGCTYCDFNQICPNSIAKK